MKYIIPFTILLFFTNLQAKEIVLFQKDKYTFTQKNLNELIMMTEYIARDRLSNKDKKFLKIWAIDDFKSAVKSSDFFYQSLSKNVVPYLNLKDTRKSYPTELYRDIVNMFDKHPEYSDNPLNLLSIINHYNPPKQELLALQKQEEQLQLQLLQMNQQSFNMIMNSTQAHSNIINNSISQQSTINAIRLAGDTVLYESDTHIIAKDSIGKEYKVAK